MKNWLLSASALAGGMLLATNAFAQTTDQGTLPTCTNQTTENCTPAGGVAGAVTPSVGTPAEIAQASDAVDPKDANPEEILVTGSRIRRPNLDSAVPVTSIAGDAVFQQGNTNVGDLLNNLPQLRSTFSQQNPGSGIGIAGLNLLDLRGLGTSRTLVLVNGRRHVAADILNNAVSPDVNTIPNDLIERIDIVTGAQSSIYGSDAIAGVVNFVLRREYDGIQLRGQAGVSEKGFGGNQYVSAMAGKTFADGRANITLHGEYSHQQRVFGSDIPWFRRVDGLGLVDVDPSLPNGSDGFPDRTFLRDMRSAAINRFGLVPITQPGANAQCGTGIGTTNGAPGIGSGSTVGTPYNCTYIFTPDGRLTPQTGTRYGQGIIGGILGGNGQTGREGELLSVLPYQQRLNFNLLAHFTVSPAFEPFVEAKWNRVDSLGSNAGPSFIQGTFSQLDLRERIRLDNPFLNPADRTTIANAILASGCNPSLTAPCSVTGVTSSFNRTARQGQGIGGPLNADDRAAIAAGTYRFVDSRVLADSGIRDEQFRRDTYRIVGGVRGDFASVWNYEVSVNYGKFTEDTVTFGYLDRQRFLLSLDAGRNPTTGQIQCRAQFDPAARVAFAGSDARLANDIAACVPYNPFGGADNSSAANYFRYNARNRASLSQFDVQGYIGGDLSQLFSLPGGPIGFSLGGEYRRERARYQNDPFIESGATNAVIIGEFDPPKFEVKEAFGEVRIPLLKDTPFFHELTINGAGRVSDYTGAVGTVWTYNFGGEWAPIRDIRFRANYGKSVRAPNVSETGFPAVPNFAPGFLDPCASGNIANNPNRAGNCLADLGATLLAGLPNVSYSLPIISGSNPNLQPETSKSLTLGAIVQPQAVPGFSLTVDYFDIKVNNVIVSLTAQQIANNCYDQPNLNNIFCSLFTRYRGSGAGSLGEQPGQILGNSLVSAGVNFAKRVRRGIDVQAAYRKEFSSEVRFNTNLIYTHLLKSSNFENPTLPNFENRLLSELGDAQDEFRLDNDLSVGSFTLGYRLRYIGPMFVNFYEDFNELPSACTAAGCPPNNLDYADIRKYPRVFYHDLRFTWNLNDLGNFGKNFQFYGGVDNVFNKIPPLGSSGTGAGSSIYDIRGRNIYAGVRARF
ncbi:TonB-dependent receptor domain-containing protein [Sphingomonas melonis]|uniref:Outer membrane receptor protein involved in Fe transport n=1 Tax=Sphingomonas melonis TaxID=152682 RepID=A0A7Y9FS89_9SPHN|nr:TonB-dependent receptor [Sphingomonas melonis]NYD92182.1 outer membrane receptor protein involved in Fe transport [Sphingomonas melonis]